MSVSQLALAAFSVVVEVSMLVGGGTLLYRGWRDYKDESLLDTLIQVGGGLVLILLGAALLFFVGEKLIVV